MSQADQARPSSVNVPSKGSKPVIARSSVDLPAPFGPTMAVHAAG